MSLGSVQWCLLDAPRRDDSIGLYGRVQRCKSSNRAGNPALETKAEVVQGQCSILARFEPNKFWGMYQVGKTPVDIQIFRNSHRPIVRFLAVQLERDGNLKCYYWARAHAQTDWVLDCQAITETRELSSPFGPYGLCRPVSGPPVWKAEPRWTLGSFQGVDGDDQSCDFCSGNDDMGFERWSYRFD
jgi:hypothetical protein